MKFSRAGFTMIEVLIVTALTIATAVAGFTGFSTFRKSQTLKLGVQELAATLSAARQQSIAQENGTGWGVRLTSGSSTDAHTYKVFSGSSFAAGTTTQSYVLGRGAKFSNPYTSSTMDVLFAGATGFPSSSQVITLINGFTDGQIGDVIVKSLGSIATRLDTGLVGYWHLDEGTGTTAYDASGYGENGTLVSGPTWQTSSNCKAGTCLSFDSTDDYVSLSNISVNTASSQKNTVEFWMYWNGVTTEMPFGFTSYDLYLTSGAFGFNHGCGDVWGISSSGMSNKWLHVAAIFYNGNYLNEQLYIDGVQQTLSQRVGTSCNRSVTTSARIGTWVNSLYIFGGKIDELKIYNRELTASEVLAAYNDLK